MSDNKRCHPVTSYLLRCSYKKSSDSFVRWIPLFLKKCRHKNRIIQLGHFHHHTHNKRTLLTSFGKHFWIKQVAGVHRDCPKAIRFSPWDFSCPFGINVLGVSLCAGSDMAQYSVLTCCFSPERAVKLLVQWENQRVLHDKQKCIKRHWTSYYPFLA